MTADRTASVVAAIDAVIEWAPGEPGPDAMVVGGPAWPEELRREVYPHMVARFTFARWEAAANAERINAMINAMMRHVPVFRDALAKMVEAVAEAAVSFEGLTGAIHAPIPEPVDVRARALAARQARNTGPARGYAADRREVRR